jgi:hypothetical protein
MTQLAATLPPETGLARLRQPELAELFAGLPAASPRDLSGHTWRGRALAPLALEKAPRPLLGLLCALLATPLNPWRGKRFDGAEGVNAWLGGALTLGSYRLEERVSPVDGHSVLWLDYDLAANPALLRAIRGEARVLADDVFLCRMNWRTAAGYATVLYFTLRRD